MSIPIKLINGFVLSINVEINMINLTGHYIGKSVKSRHIVQLKAFIKRWFMIVYYITQQPFCLKNYTTLQIEIV